MSENKAHHTIQHEVVRAWAEERGGKPAVISGSRQKKYGGILRIDFYEQTEPLETVSWPDFFTIFEDRKLAFLFQEETADGKVSRFYKFLKR
ncbi:MAG: hypothetical protein COV10_02450 [Candidatus Vogelbacteria bacterium CG10_big_fil_rev_8_21_14_0_10_51_16]|uniref:1,4-alpha-glucan branching enzyme n=1 Tax=Candidatus Vogelbacteria bacterium CG10_big_fil_rev_8_21_14_0_10_51_16 TaxID=1975045 RepID=A0A2H0REJ7_9BACT|nr:MAG: hypothetical protein COV10_02450 [Candidatus Vogelbacteria bacterium CG10_big_fil_rev_8_21_14_0_10_51_16]